MRIKTVLVSTVFASTLFTFAPDAFAQKGVFYNPASDWAVTQIDGDGSAGYCALARRFQQNTILTVARNKTDEASIALDFQRPKLNAGQLLPVTLDPGAGQQRNFNITPSSSNALVVRLGKDDAFFAALEKTGYLRAEIGPKSYHFNLADIDAGQSDLRACIASMTQPAAGEETPSITPYPFEATTAGYIPKSSSTDIKALEAENEKLRLTLAELRTQGHKSSANYNKRAVADVERLKSENAKLKQSLSLVQNGADASQELKAQIAALKDQNEQLKRLSAQNVDADKRGLVLSLTEENRRLQEELSKASSSVTPQETQEFIASLEQENAVLRQSLEQAKAQPAVQPSNNTAELESLETEIWRLRQDNAQLRGQVDVARRDTQASYEGRLREQKAINKKLQEALDNQDIDAGLVDGLRAQLNQLRNENRLLQQTAAQSNAQAVRQKNAEIAILKEQLRQAESSGDTSFALKDQLAKAVKERNAFKATAKAQREEIAFLKDNRPVADTSMFQAQIDALTAENEELRSEITIALATAEQEADQTTEIIALQQENLSLNAQIEEYSAQASELQMAKAELQQVQAQNETLVEQLTAASAGSGDLTVELDAALANNEILKTHWLNLITEQNQKIYSEMQAYPEEVSYI